MRKTKETHTFDFRPLGLAIREARERAGLSRNDLGDKVFYGERHIADIENTGSHPSFQLFHDLVTMFNISVDVVGGIGDKRSRQHEHHHKVNNGVKCLAGFSFYQSRVGNI